MSRLALLILLCCAPLAAQDAAALIERLASDDWRTRERASRDLVALGDDARESLRSALSHDDAEVRARASVALIQIGETFGHAVECATSTEETLARHGRTALMQLFRIDDRSVLREISANELRAVNYFGGPSLVISMPPELGLAQLSATTGVSIVVGQDAAEAWARVMQQPTLSMSLPGGGRHLQFARDGLARALAQVPGRRPGEVLSVVAMRLGRAVFFYVTASGEVGAAQRCGRELVQELLSDGPERVRAAALLAEGAAGESAVVERIRSEYDRYPENELLMWLALALGDDEALRERVARRGAAPVIELLRSGSWSVLEMASRYLRCLEPEEIGAALSPSIQESSSALEVAVTLWISRGSPISEPARERVNRLLSSRQQTLAAAAADWLAGADEIQDQELAALWQAAERATLGGLYMRAVLEIAARDDVRPRLLERARAGLGGNSDTLRALSARVLVGAAHEGDLSTILERLGSARGNVELARRLTAILEGAEALPGAARKLLVDALLDTNAQQRDVYLRALRRLGPELRASVCKQAMSVLHERAGGEAQSDAPEYLILARIALLGVLAGTGDAEALESLTGYARAEKLDHATAAGRAMVDAVGGDELFPMLEDWRTRPGLIHGMPAAIEAYVEICRRAADAGDRAAFRRAMSAVMGVNHQNAWQARNLIGQLQVTLEAEAEAEEPRRRLPPTIQLDQTGIDAA